MRHVSAVLMLAALCSASAWAQEEADSYRSAVSVVGGLSIASAGPLGRSGAPFGRGGDAAFAVGGGLARDLSSRFTVEASGLYLDRGSEAWMADAGFRLNVVPSGRSVVPYFAASGGVYSERSFSANDRRFQEGGRFPQDRNDDARARGSRRTDGMLTLGGGARFAAGPHVFVRPDVRAQMVFARATRVAGLFTLSFGYRF